MKKYLQSIFILFFIFCVKGASAQTGYNNGAISGLVTGSSGLGYNIYSNSNTQNGSYMSLWGPTVTGFFAPRSGSLDFVSYTSSTAVGGFTFWNYNATTNFWGTLLKISSAGNVDLGSNPNGLAFNSKLTVEGDIQLYNASGGSSRIMSQTSTGGLNLFSGSGNVDGTSLSLYGNTASTHPGTVQVIANGTTTGASAFELLTYNSASSSNNLLFKVTKDGKMIIGSNGTTPLTTPGSYNLYVSGGILTQRLKIANPSDASNWADFVFNKDYELMPLGKLASFVVENKHLPEIPSAIEVAKEGIDVAGMDAKLLQKIEELTLYAIQQQKNIEEQQKTIEAQQKRLKSLEDRLK